MDGLVVVAACVLLSIAAVVLYVSDVSISRAERDALQNGTAIELVRSDHF